MSPSRPSAGRRSLPLATALVVWGLALGADLSAQEAASRDLRGLARERLLTLGSGQVLREEARWREGTWEVKRGGRWEALPAGSVQDARLERELLGQARRRLAALARDDLEGRVELAAWMLDAGLHQEGLQQLDEVLGAAPDHGPTLALLERPDLPVAVPAWSPRASDPVAARRALIDYGAASTLPVQELVVQQLVEAGAHDRNGLAADLERALVTQAPGRRAFAGLALRRLFPGRGLQPLMQRAVLDPSGLVRTASCLALRDAHEPGVVPPLVKALEDESSIVRTHAATALGFLGQPAAVEPLARHLQRLAPTSGGSGPRSHIFVGRQISYVQDFEPEIAQGAAIANPEIGIIQEGAVLDVRVHGVGGGSVGYEFSTETRELRRALGRLTGARVTDTNAAWKRWWRTQGEQWLAEHVELRPTTSPEAPSQGEGG